MATYGISKKYFVQVSDKRLGNRFAIASKIGNGSIIHTNYMTYDEFNAYLCGYDCIALAKVNAVGWLFAAILAIVGIAILRDYIQEELNAKNQK